MKARLIELAPQHASSITVKKIQSSHFETPFHFHDYCELNYVKKSSGKRVVGDSIDNFSGGELVLMSPDLPHVWYNDPETIDESSPTSAEAIVVYFPIDFLDKLSTDKTVLSKRKSLFEKAKRGLYYQGDTLKRVGCHLERMTTLQGLGIVIEFLEIINILLDSKDYTPLASKRYSHIYSEKDSERMNQVYKYIINNFTEPISLAAIASVANMTPPAFCKFFKAKTQMPFTRFVNEVRVGHACKLLQDETKSISDVCYESGFQNFANFNKFFKEIQGKTPGNYRKEMSFSRVHA